MILGYRFPSSGRKIQHPEAVKETTDRVILEKLKTSVDQNTKLKQIALGVFFLTNTGLVTDSS